MWKITCYIQCNKFKYSMNVKILCVANFQHKAENIRSTKYFVRVAKKHETHRGESNKYCKKKKNVNV